jgi:hypothetical protein
MACWDTAPRSWLQRDALRAAVIVAQIVAVRKATRR